MYEIFGIKIVMWDPSGIVLLVLGGFFLTCAIAIWVTLWRADPIQLAEARRLINLVKEANKGGRQAKEQCRNEPDLKEKLAYRLVDGRLHYTTFYVVPWSVIFRVFGVGT